jgi:hypothetical protein
LKYNLIKTFLNQWFRFAKYSLNSRRMIWAGHAARMREKWNAYRILLGKPEGKKPLGRPRHR